MQELELLPQVQAEKLGWEGTSPAWKVRVLPSLLHRAPLSTLTKVACVRGHCSSSSRVQLTSLKVPRQDAAYLAQLFLPGLTGPHQTQSDPIASTCPSTTHLPPHPGLLGQDPSAAKPGPSCTPDYHSSP